MTVLCIAKIPHRYLDSHCSIWNTLHMTKNFTDEMIATVASSAHDAWREDRKLSDGTYEPRIKSTTNGSIVDIANTDYDELPEEWQRENRKGAESALIALQMTDDVDAAAAFVHGAWSARNASWAPAHLLVHYSELPEDEREKDRHFVRLAMKAKREEI